MFTVVSGGSGSGKSAYAENRILEFGSADRIYIATMMCFDEESRKRVRRHREMRRGKGFDTVECYLDLEHLRLEHTVAEKMHTNVLLECMSNLTANEMFDPSGSGEQAGKFICRGIDRLLEQCDNLVVVTNEVFSDGICYDKETEKYRTLLGEINCYMASIADEVVEVVYGIPVLLKGRK